MTNTVYFLPKEANLDVLYEELSKTLKIILDQFQIKRNFIDEDVDFTLAQILSVLSSFFDLLANHDLDQYYKFNTDEKMIFLVRLENVINDQITRPLDYEAIESLKLLLSVLQELLKISAQFGKDQLNAHNVLFFKILIMKIHLCLKTQLKSPTIIQFPNEREQ